MSTQPVQSNSGSGAASGAGNGNSSTTASSNSLSDQQTFITLLVAQLQNQDPLDPADGTQFLTQLAEINNVQQLESIHQDTDSIVQDLSASGTTQTGSSSGSGTGSAGNTNPATQ